MSKSQAKQRKGHQDKMYTEPLAQQGKFLDQQETEGPKSILIITCQTLWFSYNITTDDYLRFVNKTCMYSAQ